MKKRNVKKLRLNKKSISRIQESAISGGDVSLPDPATEVICVFSGADFCNSWLACNTRLDNVTCVFTGGPTSQTQEPGTTFHTTGNITTINIGC